MSSSLNEFIEILTRIKREYEDSIKTSVFNGEKYDNGNKAKEALIRSQKLIGYIHEFVKQEFVKKGIKPAKIYPPLNSTKPEINLVGFLKKKNQDVCIIPEAWGERPAEQIKDGALAGEIDVIGTHLMEKSISVNIRSQLSSLDKNFDTLYERTFAEAFNLHMRTPKICLGEVYLIPTHEYNDEAMLRNKVEFKRLSKLEKYIHAFQALNMRTDDKINQHMYERVWLVIADFQKSPPKLYLDIKELIKEGLVGKDTSATLKRLTIDGFIEDLLSIYKKRFKLSNLT